MLEENLILPVIVILPATIITALIHIFLTILYYKYAFHSWARHINKFNNIILLSFTINSIYNIIFKIDLLYILITLPCISALVITILNSKLFSKKYHIITVNKKQTEHTDSSKILLIESNIDDMTGEHFGFLVEQMFNSGAIDVWYTPVFGKKNRPMYLISILAAESNYNKIITVFFKYSSTAGVRIRVVEREIMNRGFIKVEVSGIVINVKKLWWQDIVKYSPEWDECAMAANKLDKDPAEIHSEAKIKAKQIDMME